MWDNVIIECPDLFSLASPPHTDHDYPMSNSSAAVTTLLPAPTGAAMRSAEVHPTLKPLCKVRMAEADAADIEVCQLAEEISRTMRKPAKTTRKRNADQITQPVTY